MGDARAFEMFTLIMFCYLERRSFKQDECFIKQKIRFTRHADLPLTRTRTAAMQCPLRLANYP
jgi:hypothetical protein